MAIARQELIRVLAAIVAHVRLPGGRRQRRRR
jgi:hypothetical protein